MSLPSAFEQEKLCISLSLSNPVTSGAVCQLHAVPLGSECGVEVLELALVGDDVRSVPGVHIEPFLADAAHRLLVGPGLYIRYLERGVIGAVLCSSPSCFSLSLPLCLHVASL